MPWMEQARLLLRKARADAAAMRTLADNPDILDAIVGFHAQQACEKGLKATLAARGIAYPRTHSLERLLGLLATAGITVPESVDEALVLAPFAVEVRYDDPSDEHLDRARVNALVDTVLAWCETNLPQPSEMMATESHIPDQPHPDAI